MRRYFLKSILNQDVQFFDKNETGDLTTRLASDTALYQEGISEKWGLGVAYSVTFVTGFIIGFIKSWQLTLVLLAAVPVLATAGGLVGVTIAAGIRNSQGAFAKAGAIAQEALANIKTVYAFNGQERMLKKFEVQCDIAVKFGEQRALRTGAAFGVFFGSLFGIYALGFWYGSVLVN